MVCDGRIRNSRFKVNDRFRLELREKISLQGQSGKGAGIQGGCAGSIPGDSQDLGRQICVTADPACAGV